MWFVQSLQTILKGAKQLNFKLWFSLDVKVKTRLTLEGKNASLLGNGKCVSKGNLGRWCQELGINDLTTRRKKVL